MIKCLSNADDYLFSRAEMKKNIIAQLNSAKIEKNIYVSASKWKKRIVCESSG